MSSSPANLSNLPRHTLSVLLSYLQQHPPAQNHRFDDLKGPHNRDAISLLITNKRFAFAILPLFRLPKHLCKIHQHQTHRDGGSHANESCTTAVMLEKYRFITLPIQDPRTLLDKLNTRRLRRRILWKKHIQQQRQQEVGSCTKANANNIWVCTKSQTCYQLGRTVDELALEEWLMLQIHRQDDENGDENNKNEFQEWPSHLELLRFSDSSYFRDTIDLQDSETSLCTPTECGVDKKIKFKVFPFLSRKPQDLNRQDVEAGNHWLEHDNMFGHNITLLSSYPRSGNTLMRTLLERITSTVTGSDTRPDRSLSIKLAQEHDLVGEGLVGNDFSPNDSQTSRNNSLSRKRRVYQTYYDPMVNVVKTHFPERKGWKQVTANRVILLVRNPYDAIDSYWNLCCTNTHTSSLDESVYEKYATKFTSMARHEIKIWCKFHYYWFDVCARDGIPMLVVRYEDLILNTEAEMLRVLNFLSVGKNGTLDAFWRWRITHALGKSRERQQPSCNIGKEAYDGSTSTAYLGSYRPRSSNGGLDSIGKSLRKNRYSESVLCHMHDVAASLELERKWSKKNAQNQQTHMTLLQRFGYDIPNQGFPSNFAKMAFHPMADSSSLGNNRQQAGSIQINTSPEIRSSDDPFGRAMTTWRRGETKGDREPFPTVPR
ncbi:hypothetical protein HJC23_000516 [Cyclotella cryptica]|uniref:Sulfotransferase domain-containing protein n=1 Tax=Cyclotella cryptica TaxID=29204 RepID=A0ABD3NVV7_9STRA|eukprot:CCRYP_019657-RA/>CCRYP_019657-RA protein AED:0.06 eAED:0.06 QI:4016/1/1/1/0.5/0.33/3/131/656